MLSEWDAMESRRMESERPFTEAEGVPPMKVPQLTAALHLGTPLTPPSLFLDFISSFTQRRRCSASPWISVNAKWYGTFFSMRPELNHKQPLAKPSTYKWLQLCVHGSRRCSQSRGQILTR